MGRYQPQHAASRSRLRSDRRGAGRRGSARPRRGSLGGWAAVFGLAAVALAVPVLRVVGPDPEFFIAHQAEPSEVVVFGMVVGIVLPAALATLGEVLVTAGWLLRAALVAVLASLVAAAQLQVLASSVVFVPAAGLVGMAVAYFDRPGSVVRTMLVLAAIAGLAATGWFLGLSRTAEYVRAPTAAQVADLEQAGGPPRTPVVLLVFDELPVAALLTDELAVDASRFPAFAALAEQSDWYRLASSVSPQTANSVPAILSGQAPQPDRLPIAAEHPTNLFVQLGGGYEVHAREAITALCPPAVCGAAGAGGAPGGGDGTPQAAVPPLASDALVVLGHAIGNDQLRDELAPIDQGWGGFGAGALAADDTEHDASGSTPQEVYGTFAEEAASATSWASSCTAAPEPGAPPPLCVAHLVVPHGPYVAQPDGSTYPQLRPEPGASTADGSVTWSDDEAQRSQAYQRLQLQLGATDRLLGDLVQRLQDSGVWEDAAVAVVADHGITFEPGAVRAGESAAVTGVPLFIKAPGQTEGRVHDDAALTIDAVPTLLGLAGVRPQGELDGLDLRRDPIPVERRGAYLRQGDGRRITPTQSTEALGRQVRTWAGWLPPGRGWEAVYGLGPAADRVGQDIGPAGGTALGSWTLRDEGAEQASVAAVHLTATTRLRAVLAVHDGVVVATQPGVDVGEHLRTLVLPPGIDPSTTSLFGLDGAGGIGPLERR